MCSPRYRIIAPVKIFKRCIGFSPNKRSFHVIVTVIASARVIIIKMQKSSFNWIFVPSSRAIVMIRDCLSNREPWTLNMIAFFKL